ncbi:MAG TPA: hypothetical protein VLB90_09840 [Pseudomonadales bacterium]|nr:hypothetical protein [Pseudomonadales bacterium]
MLTFFKRSIVLRLVIGYGAVFFLGLALAGVFSLTRVTKLVDNTIDSYGATVATQLANNSLDAVMQRDMISLQAQLSRLLKTPGIVSAVIYDAKNELMAQAGATPSELNSRDYVHNYSATLALGDNMTGSVVVTLETREIEHLLPEARWVLVVIGVIVLLLLLVISRYFARDIKQQQSVLAQALNDCFPLSMEKLKTENMSEDDIRLVLGQLREHVERVQAPSPAALRDAAADLLNSGGGRVYLLLECHNLDLLQRQVSRDRLRALLDQMQLQVEKTCRLYNAQRMPAAGSCIKMVMAAEAGRITDVLLQAACCARVLAGVLEHCRDSELGIQLQWSLALDWHAPCDNDILRNRQQALDEQRSQWLCRQVGSSQLAVSADAGALLQDQDKLTLAVEHGEGGKPFYRVTGFVQTQRVLLDGQIAHLLDC